LGVFIVLWLHAKSFLAQIIWEYFILMYGLVSLLIYASAVFICSHSMQGSKIIFLIKSDYLQYYLSVFIIFSNNYAGIEKQHLIAKHMIEKEQKKIDKNLEK
jgi:hypothetical protein